MNAARKNIVDRPAAARHRPGMTLHQIIRDKGFRQGWVAEQIGITQGHFSEIKTGAKPLAIEKLRPLAELLGITIDEVLDAIEAAKREKTP